MRRHRTTALTILCVLLTGLAATAVSAPARGAGRGAVPKLVFPLVAKTDLWDNYGDPRPNGRHQGIDMENPWHAPAVAVEDGRVEYAQSNLGGCMLYLYGRSGTMYLYIHLNNDLTAKNDNRGGCARDVTFTIPDGAKVTAGQQVAWVGDSGDANGNPHLHFEVHPERRNGRRPVQVPRGARASRSSRHAPARCSASPCAENCCPAEPELRRSRSSASASTRADAGSTSTRAPSRRPFRLARRSPPRSEQ